LDIKVKKDNKATVKRLSVLALIVSIVVIAFYYSAVMARSGLSIAKESLIYAEVKQGDFSVKVNGSGVLVPDKIQWLSASVDAHVERVVVKPGKAVKKGELIIELTNIQLQQLLEETRWELTAKIAESKASKVEQMSALLEKEALMLDAQLKYESSQLKLNAQQELFDKKTGAVSKIDYEKTSLETKQFKQRWKIQKKILQSMKDNVLAQNNARDSRLHKMRKTLERAEQQVKNLMIYATIDSVVQEVTVEPGQRIVMGSKLAKLAEKNSLIAELQIAELLIGEVSIGQQVVIDTRNNKVDGRVIRVDPAVVNGKVQVDVAFVEPLPADARPDLSVDGEIMITEIFDTLYVNRPIFSQSKTISMLYKLDKQEEFAQRVKVNLGKGSMSKIQVIEGLVLGDKIIISDPSRWKNHKEIRLN
jgi:multidrug resistance efflux pump